jgi:hypothetical protein
MDGSVTDASATHVYLSLIESNRSLSKKTRPRMKRSELRFDRGYSFTPMTAMPTGKTWMSFTKSTTS